MGNQAAAELLQEVCTNVTCPEHSFMNVTPTEMSLTIYILNSCYKHKNVHTVD